MNCALVIRAMTVIPIRDLPARSVQGILKRNITVPPCIGDHNDTALQARLVLTSSLSAYSSFLSFKISHRQRVCRILRNCSCLAERPERFSCGPFDNEFSMRSEPVLLQTLMIQKSAGSNVMLSCPRYKELPGRGMVAVCRRGRAFASSAAPAGSETQSQAARFAPKVKAWTAKVSYCAACGGAMEQRIPEGEAAPRAVCTVCGRIHYLNPKMVVVCLVEHEGQVLLCKRKIDPCAGLWTLPGGYMELGESAPEGAARETWEEARADVAVTAPFAHLDIPLIGQSYIIFRARFRVLEFAPGPESLETTLFPLDKIPFDKIAFSAIRVALEKYVEDAKTGHFHVHLGVIDKRSRLADPSFGHWKAYTLPINAETLIFGNGAGCD